jgi:uncharacterized membrane protein
MLPNLHPLAVHFPIALLPLAVGLDLLGIVHGRTELRAVARWTLWLGTLGAAVAVLTGHEAADVLRPEVGTQAGTLMTTHHDVAMGVLGAAAVLSVWRLIGAERARALYLAVAVALVAAVVVVADLGGRMVFVHGVAVRASKGAERCP